MVDPRRCEVLSDENLRWIDQALNVFLAKWQNLPLDQKPQAVVFTDTSARPLAYLFKPLLHALSTRVSLPDPQISFVASHRDKDFIDVIWNHRLQKNEFIGAYVELHAQRLRTKILKVERRIARRGTLTDVPEDHIDFTTELERLQKDLKDVQDKAEVLYASWQELLTRLRQIVERARRVQVDAKAIQVLVVDEQVFEGLTIKLLERAFEVVAQDVGRDVGVQVQARFFTFWDDQADKASSDTEDFRKQLGDRYIVGCPKVVGGDFAFRINKDGSDAGARFTGVNKALTGVVARRDTSVHLDDVQFIRQLFTEIGEKKAQSLSLLQQDYYKE